MVLQVYFHKVLKLSYFNVTAKATFCSLYKLSSSHALDIHHTEAKNIYYFSLNYLKNEVTEKTTPDKKKKKHPNSSCLLMVVNKLNMSQQSVLTAKVAISLSS